MNYRYIYLKIISNAKKQNRSKHNGVYYELHHVLPKSIFPNWKNKKSSLVLLTAREHFFCHQLLTKIYPGRAMNYALVRLMYSNNNPNKKEKIKISSKEYERIKKLNCYFGIDNPNFGNKWSDEQKKKASKATKEWLKGNRNPNFGNKWSDEQKKNLANKKKNRHFYTNGYNTICVIDGEEPEGYIKGHHKSFSPKTEEGKKKQIEKGKKAKHDNNKGLKWFHDSNGKNLMAKECPKGFFPGKYISEERLLEMKKKNSLAHKGKITRNIKIKDIDNNIVFFSLKEAAKYHNISPSLMSAIVKGKRKKIFNFILL